MELRRGDLQLSKEKAEPSRRLIMWVRTSDGKAEMVLAPLDFDIAAGARQIERVVGIGLCGVSTQDEKMRRWRGEDDGRVER
ncbi:hypothetical protein MRB53_020004 [Persea americana]|uniref:Uncharacterized protein n=1 Tax=Persea americana TaxID=3435 RepID=A0ACC2KZQ1_PERAE|nr:hypothetical protein MRB53_020004 [Persea americana]